RAIQYAILAKLPDNEAITAKIEQQLSSIAALSEAASLAVSNALTDELVSHGEMMSTLIFTEIMRQKGATASWFDIRQVMLTDNHFGKASPDLTAVAQAATSHLLPALAHSIIITQ